MNILRFLLIGVAALVAGLIGWRYKGAPVRGEAASQVMAAPKPISTEKARQEVSAQLNKVAEYLPFYARLTQDFPGDQSQVVQTLVAKTASAGTVDSPDAALIDAIRALQNRRGIVAARAEADKLLHIFDAQSAIIAGLADSNPSLCREFLYGGSSDGFLDFAASHRGLIAALAIAGLEAIENGQNSGIGHDSPTDADLDALAQALAHQGLSEGEIAALMDGVMPREAISDARMCEIGRIHLEALRNLPEPSRSRVLALAVRLMAHS
jgi:hypothetical protein